MVNLAAKMFFQDNLFLVMDLQKFEHKIFDRSQLKFLKTFDEMNLGLSNEQSIKRKSLGL